MKWASALSQHPRLETAFEICASSLMVDLEGELPDLVLAFVSPHFAQHYQHIPSLARETFGNAMLLGCSGRGVIGGGHEVEGEPGLALSAAVLPGVNLHPFRLDADALPDPDAPPDAWEEAVGVPAQDNPHFILLADPLSFPTETLVEGLDYAFPHSVKVGGLVSGGMHPSAQGLFLESSAFSTGAVGIALQGNIVVDTVVAQGCRPIGKPFIITKARDTLLQELEERPPLEVLRETLETLGEHDQRLARHSLFVGIVTDPLKEHWDTGDFHIRNLMGVDSSTGALAVGEHLREGQTIQFHLRDAETSRDDLQHHLERYTELREDRSVAGAVLFSCTGRGVGLYQRPDHDSTMFFDSVGHVPLAGFFCNGEIGPVAGATYLHGYTSSFGIFRPRHALMPS